MKKRKDFDCVEMKNSIQSIVVKENARLIGEQIRTNRLTELEKSTTPFARAWKKSLKQK